VTAAALAAWAVAATVVLDPGHGGAESGARSASGLFEKDVTLAIARVARRELEAAGVTVVLTRTADVDLALNARIDRANRLGAAAFVSIHANSSPNRGRRGHETYVASIPEIEADAPSLVAREEANGMGSRPPPSTGLEALLDELDAQAAHRRSARLSVHVRAELAEVSGLEPNRGVRQATFHVLQAARVPAVLVECGYLTHREQATYLATAAAHEAIGAALARGILEFLGS